MCPSRHMSSFMEDRVLKYVCQVCGYVYDEEKEGVPFAELPDDWSCPLCKAPKSEFKAQESESKNEEEAAKTYSADEIDLKELSAGQMAALCTNLARACEKQYKTKESEQFTQLAEYFERITSEIPDANIDNVLAMLKWDIQTYEGTRAKVDADSDRGAARALVWGEKVSRMLASLLDQYKTKGEALLSGTHIWVCTACGFVYIGDEAPSACPVCKVPDWKFEKIEGRA